MLDCDVTVITPGPDGSMAAICRQGSCLREVEGGIDEPIAKVGEDRR